MVKSKMYEVQRFEHILCRTKTAIVLKLLTYLSARPPTHVHRQM